MQYKTKIAATFKKEFKRLYKRYPSLEQDVKNLREEILTHPTTIGTDLGGGLRKIRMRITAKGKGKSGGARVITFTVVVSTDASEIHFLYLYDKSERSSITQAEIEALLKACGLL
ncbi:MAG TPA: type II toxin-antitoxin system RelE/ParE family toxin [Candidatus Parabacteroides intestinavium]|nr:type II toxin-antitoxin system RelE/ParE family toxin [Candidatus Parabacteroides intestinavium]